MRPHRPHRPATRLSFLGVVLCSSYIHTSSSCLLAVGSLPFSVTFHSLCALLQHLFSFSFDEGDIKSFMRKNKNGRHKSCSRKENGSRFLKSNLQNLVSKVSVFPPPLPRPEGSPCGVGRHAAACQSSKETHTRQPHPPAPVTHFLQPIRCRKVRGAGETNGSTNTRRIPHSTRGAAQLLTLSHVHLPPFLRSGG